MLMNSIAQIVRVMDNVSTRNANVMMIILENIVNSKNLIAKVAQFEANARIQNVNALKVTGVVIVKLIIDLAKIINATMEASVLLMVASVYG